MSKSLCKGKRTSQPNRCKKIQGCKVASGKKRTFCRKRHNKSTKTKKTQKRRTQKRRTEVEILSGVSLRKSMALRKIKKQLK
jgi:hypothetical protein